VARLAAKTAALTTSENGGRLEARALAENGAMLSRLEVVSSATVTGDDFLHKVYDVGGRLFRVVLSQHVALVAAARFSRYEAEHPVSPPASFTLIILIIIVIVSAVLVVIVVVISLLLRVS